MATSIVFGILCVVAIFVLLQLMWIGVIWAGGAFLASKTWVGYTFNGLGIIAYEALLIFGMIKAVQYIISVVALFI